MKKWLGVIVGLSALAGCASTKTVSIDAQKLEQMNVTSVGLTKRDKPDFSALTADKAMFALAGALASIAAGNELIEENKVDDPAAYIRTKLVEGLVNKYGYSFGEPTFVDSTKPAKITPAFSGQDLVLDIETINWSFGYFPTDWNNYRVMYSAKLRLIDTKSNKIIAEGFCARVPEQSDTAPSYDELLADEAAVIKSELKSAADQCIQEFKTKVFNLQEA